MTAPLVLAATAVLFGLACSSRVSADPSLTIRIGPEGPPPSHEDRRWESPHRTAVWIPGHNEWNDGRYVWVGGYYTYPPRENNHWIQPVYSHQQDGYYYRPGYWSN